MEYPQGFPAHLQPPIEAAIAEADIEFVKSKKRLRFSCFGNDHAVDKLILRYVKKAFFALAQQARAAVADGLWTGEQVRSALDDSLHKLVVNAYHQKNTHGGAILELLEGDATRRMEQEVKESNEWLEHQKELAVILKAQAARDPVRHRALDNFAKPAFEATGSARKLSPENANKGADRVAMDREALLRAYKDEGAKQGLRITDKMIAQSASSNWHDRTPVQRWKRNDPRSKPGDDAAIRRVLQRKPHLTN